MPKSQYIVRRQSDVITRSFAIYDSVGNLYEGGFSTRAAAEAWRDKMEREDAADYEATENAKYAMRYEM